MNDDVDISVEQGDEADESLGRKTTQLIVPEIGNVRLRNSKSLRDSGLAEIVRPYNLILPRSTSNALSFSPSMGQSISRYSSCLLSPT